MTNAKYDAWMYITDLSVSEEPEELADGRLRLNFRAVAESARIIPAGGWKKDPSGRYQVMNGHLRGSGWPVP
jgi:hypothetical protein